MANGRACCTALSAVLGDLTFSPTSLSYDSSQSSYWSLQEAEVEPSCVVQPKSAEDVSVAIKTMTAIEGCHFAIRSGGHSPNAGAANIASGVTVDLSQLGGTIISDDRSTVSINPGSTWAAVYETLDLVNLTVAGGRSGGVGVGGLTTGGGISFLSPRVGFSCDNVLNYEVVLANGSIVDSQDDADLHISLSGGSNNFGIVTRIDFAAIEQGLIWGGNVYYSIDTIDSQLQAFANISNADTYDDYSSLIMSLAYDGLLDLSLVANAIEYTKAEIYPPVFQPLMAIPAIDSTMRLDTVAGIAEELATLSPGGSRVLFMTITHGNSISMLNAVYQAWSDSIADISKVAGIIWTFSLEPLPPAIYARSSSNSLGLSDRNGTLVVGLLTAQWTDAADDNVVEATAKKLHGDIQTAAEGLGEDDPFLYLNYANTAGWQGDPIASYGEASVARLRSTSSKVDPEGVFQKNVPGGFKLT
ncbi:FAD-binding domain-containing protein [Cryphonectria parasitica EP155]|uniref:FAD-binding domain-containing protein n=1 Tax=Cryphonectria parasitica (strain ATCC 38755 / EP155) TaxID=660469 RepID=A0A9P5CPN7_CRYP1|nr:FAD-binding domain-containing protein [Cryphonectria parasitica EP155]KAF3766669.1 FAD-binding domain-containing protein [Cryphonectria parasitica EP155]